MCGSMVDIQSPAAEIRRGKEKDRKIVTTGQKYNGPLFHRAAIKKKKKKPQGKNKLIMSASATQGGHLASKLSKCRPACFRNRRSNEWTL